MKPIVYLVALVLSFTTLGLSADPCAERLYVAPENIRVEGDGIFIRVHDKWFITEAVFSNAHGMYVETLWRRGESGCPEGQEPCRNCRRCIPDYYDDLCPLCGKPA